MPTVRPRTTIYLWEFLLQLLDGEEDCAAISWVNRERGEFVLKDQSEIAKLWGRVKGRPRMDKIKLGRAMRYYYKKKLLAKVPRRKAVYRFTKIDHLKQKHAGIIRHEDFPDIDFNENSLLDVIQDDKSDDGESSLPAEVDRDEDDTPLESLLAEKHQQVTQDEKCQKALRVQDSFGSMDNINEGVCSSFYDYNNEPTHFTSPNEDYFVPCSEVNPVSLHERQNYPSYIKSGAVEIESNNLPQCYYQTADYNSNYPQYEMESGGHLASLLLNSILMSDQQTLPDSTNLRDLNVPVSCTPSSGVFAQDNIVSPFTQMKSEPLSNNLAVSSQFYDTNSDATLSTLKEFERLLMINRSF